MKRNPVLARRRGPSLSLRAGFAGFAAIVAGTMVAGAATVYRDDFESAALNSFWSRWESSGSITFPATTRAHSGGQSVRLNSTSTSSNKNIELFHNFNAPVYGRASVWVYDSGADEFSANYLGFFFRNHQAGTAAGIFTQDYDLGLSNGGGYYYGAPGNESVLTAIDRTKSWHQFTIVAASDVLRLEVDGTTIYQGPGGSKFDQVTMEIHGPNWRPAWSVEFDDFEWAELPDCGPLQFADDFEGSTLGSFWSRSENSGFITFPAATRAHSGRQSVQLSSTVTAGNKNIELTHSFGGTIYGRASVWVYDSGADELSANYLGFFFRNRQAQTAAGLFTQDYDLGPGNGGHYYFGAPGNPSVNTAIDRTKAWHQLTLVSTPDALRLEVDSTPVYSASSGMPFDSVVLEIHGPNWRPAWSVQFDDFEFAELAAPIVCTQPASLTVSPGAEATFSILAGGSGALTYQWRLNGANLPGETNQVLHLNSVGNPHAGQYSVRVANALGTTDSLPATLTVFGMEMLPGITIAGPLNAKYRIDYAENLAANPPWTELTSVTLTSSPQRFVDWTATGKTRRFYRATAIP